MISYGADDVKQFMNRLLLSQLFDDWELREARLHTICRYTISGAVNPAYYSEKELAQIASAYQTWGRVRRTLTGLVKGDRPPSLFQVVLAYPLSRIREISTEPIESLLLNIHFEGGALRLISATSLKGFSLDRTYEQYWDRLLPQLLTENGIELHRETTA